MPRSIAVFFSTFACLALAGLAFVLDGPFGLSRQMAFFISGGGFIYVPLPPQYVFLLLGGGVFVVDLVRYCNEAKGRWWAGCLVIAIVTACFAGYLASRPDARPGIEMAFIYCGVLAALVNGGAREIAAVLGWGASLESAPPSGDKTGEAGQVFVDDEGNGAVEKVEDEDAEEHDAEMRRSSKAVPAGHAQDPATEENQ